MIRKDDMMLKLQFMTGRSINGSALLSALFIMTLIAIAATAMSTRLQLDIYQTRMTISSDKLYLASDVVKFWAMEQLKEKSISFTSRDETGKVLDFPEKFASMYPNVVTKGQLFDLQARFNLNNLQDKKYQTIFYHLLEQQSKYLNTIEPKQILDAIIHWISPYQPDAGRNLFVAYYMTRKPPYYPGYQLMQHVSELRSVYGVNPILYKKLLPNIATLPEVTPININTASKVILQSLGNGLKEAQVKDLTLLRGKKGLTSFEKLNPLLNSLNIPQEQLTLESNYFLSVAVVTEKDLHLIVYSVIKRQKNKKGEILISIINQTINIQ